MTTQTTTAPPRPTTFAEAEAVLAANLPRYEARTQQQELARAIETQFFGFSDPDRKRAMLAQGPTGVGKSLAYLIPAVLSGKRVIVSVTTKALQDQLAGTDLPFLRDNLMPFTWAVLKGRSSYFCLNRTVGIPDGEVPRLGEIQSWVKANATVFSGLREDLPFEVDDRHWSMMCSEGEECSALGCKNTATCYASIARRKAADARIVVVNHSLYFTDLAIRVKTDGLISLLGEHDLVVMDEAHEVHEIATSAMATQTTLGSFTSLTDQIRAWTMRNGGHDEVRDVLAQVNAAAEQFFRAVPVSRQRTLRFDVSHLEAMFPTLEALMEAVGALGVAFKRTPVSADPLANARRGSLLTRTRNLWTWLRDLVSADLAEVVRWSEVVRRKRGDATVIHTAPVEVGPYLAEHLWPKTQALLISATLAVKGRFDFQAERLGITDYASAMVESPFDYPNQGRLYVPVRMVAPTPAKKTEWESAVLYEVKALVEAAQGRTLVLFTSVAHMRSLYSSLKDVLPFPVRMQGEASVRELGEWFLASEETVLFATKSFMTGFDARGSACINVIITKMPFPVPDEPLTEARCEKIETEGGSAFADYSIPMMSLVLQQAAGRLIRHTSDRGLVAILDSRMASKGYGKAVMRDLPPMKVVYDRESAEDFLAESVAHFEEAS